MVGWHHQLDARESEWALGAGDGQGGLRVPARMHAAIHWVTKSRLWVTNMTVQLNNNNPLLELPP